MSGDALLQALWIGVSFFDLGLLFVDLNMNQINISSLSSVAIGSFFASQMPAHATPHGRHSVPRLDCENGTKGLLW